MDARSDAVVAAWMDPAKMELWTLMGPGWPWGFFMIETKGETADLAFFGLVPEAVGQGLGEWLLRTAVLTAWQREGVRRMTVQTCTLDHPRALRSYQKAGFTPVRREDHTRVLTRDRDMTRIPD